MSKFNEAADVLKRHALKYEQLMDAAAALAEVGSLEQAAREAGVAKDKAEAERDAALAESAKAKDDAKRNKDKAAHLLAIAELEVSQMLEAAKATAGATADAIVFDATNRADAVIKAGDAKREAAMGAAARARDELAAAESATRAAEVRLDQLVAETKDAETKLKRAQDSIKKLLG